MFERHFELDIPYEVIFPLQYLVFLGKNVSFPNQIEKLLSLRYKSYRIPLPYKWRCYVTTFNVGAVSLITVIIAFLYKLAVHYKTKV